MYVGRSPLWFRRWLRPKRIKEPRSDDSTSSLQKRRDEPHLKAFNTLMDRSTETRSKGAQRQGTLEKPFLPDRRLVFEVDAELSTQLRLAARSQDMPPEMLVAELLARGLEQQALRVQAEAALVALTPREQEIVWLTARGHTNSQIAKALVISPETVKTHVRHVLDKFGVRSKADLRLLFIDLGMRWWEG
jgi:DNA-binding CsgD family transcriptional regulator